MKKRKVLALLLSLALCAGLLTAPALAAEAVPCRFNYAGNFSDGLADVSLLGEDGTWRYGFVDGSGTLAVPLGTYSGVRSFSEGLAAVQKDGKWGFIDPAGRLVIPCGYDHTWDFSEGLAAVELNGKWGFIDKAGNQVIPCQYDNDMVPRFSGGVAYMMQGGRWGYINAAGQTVVPFQYDWAEDFSDGLGLVTLYREDEGEVMGFAEEFGYVDAAGTEVVPLGTYDRARSFSDGMAAVSRNGMWGFIDAAGAEAVPLRYSEAGDFSEGLAPVCQDGKWGFIDKTGSEVVPCRYQGADSFSEGLAIVVMNGKAGYIDKNGKEVIPCTIDFETLMEFSGGLARIEQGGKWGYLDKSGKLTVPCRYDEAYDFVNGFARVKLNNMWGFLSADGAAASAAEIAYASTQSVLVDGEAVEFQCYALKDAAGNDTNYVKLRDVASVLSGTAAQFEVGWDGAVNIETGKAYTANGSEMKTPFSGDRAYEPAAAETRVNGAAADLSAIVLKDDAGGAYTYYKLRDLGSALGFRVDWSAEKGIFIETK